MQIKDLVSIDEHAEFRNDVQLSDYEIPERNLALLRSYLFSCTAPKGQESSLSLLRLVTGAFSDARTKNRFTVIANYGHGKSHLALVMANYFGKPFQSDEMKVIQDKISKAVDNPARAEYFQQFRQNHAEYLVIRLRGDVQRALREQFVICLEQGLGEHAATQGVQLPFWYQNAEKWLEQLSDEDLNKANQFLDHQYSTDEPMLLQDTRERRDNAYDQCRQLHKHLHGTLPDFGGEVSLRELVNWVCSKYCGEGKPLAGILVLFDEFSLYIQRYAQRNAAGELQDLLNGIQDQQGLAVFLAFAQQDPLKIAQNVLRGTQGLDGLEKELSRIERNPKLYSLMEGVIDSYLTQPKEKWYELRSNPQARGPLARASNLAMDLFSKRYEDTLHWDTEKFDDIVTQGCFPLHPITTALLCDLQIQVIPRAGNPRTVLGFVFQQIETKRDQPVLCDSEINWVLPISLVEYFGDYLPETTYLLYMNALHILGQDASPTDLSLLQALLLQEAGHLPVRKDTQLAFLAEAAGLSQDNALQHLKMMTNSGCIRFDSRTKMNSFLSVAANPHRLEEILRQRLEGKDFSQELLNDLNREVTKPIAVDVGWGHPDDWKADEVILTKEFFNCRRIQEICAPYKISYANELQEGCRGCVIWLLAQDEDDMKWFQQNAPRVLAEAFPGDNPPPIVLMLPQKPCAELIDDYMRKKGLEDFSMDERKEVGSDVFDHEKNTRVQLAILSDLASLRGDSINYKSIPRIPNSWIVPAHYLSPIQALGKVSLEQILKECYRNAYRFSPPEFFTQYTVSGKGHNKLRDATCVVSAVLLRNSLGSNRESINIKPIAKDMVEKFLWNRWQIVTADYRIQEPGNQRILEAWNIFEQSIPAGARDVRLNEALVTLLNPPFGYDYNTLTLLSCAWIGYHLHDLEISLQGRRVKLDDLAELLAEGGKKFVQHICFIQPLSISRRDQGQIIKEIKDLIEQANRDSFTQENAQEAITKLQSFCTDQSSQPDLCDTASQAASNLSTALKLAEDYDTQATTIAKSINEEQELSDLIGLQHKIADLPRVGNVRYTANAPTQLDEELHSRLNRLVESECRRLGNIQRTTQIELHETELNKLKKQLKRTKLDELVTLVDQALQTIVERKKELTIQEQEAPIQVEIRAMDTKNQLKLLYEYRQRLKQIKGCSSATMQLCSEQLRMIESEIAQLETFAQSMQIAIDNLTTIKAVSDWQQQFLRQVERFQGTQLQKPLEVANERVGHIQELLIELDDIIKKTPADFQEASAIFKKLKQLSNQNSDLFSSDQQRLIIQAQQSLDKKVQNRMAEARQWYQKLEADFNNDRVPDVANNIKKVPPFFPESDKAKLIALETRVQQRLDEDIVVRIETQFRQITDKEIRKQCFNRLKQILDE